MNLNTAMINTFLKIRDELKKDNEFFSEYDCIDLDSEMYSEFGIHWDSLKIMPVKTVREVIKLMTDGERIPPSVLLSIQVYLEMMRRGILVITSKNNWKFKEENER